MIITYWHVLYHLLFIAVISILAVLAWLLKVTPRIRKAYRPVVPPTTLNDCRRKWKDATKSITRSGKTYLVIGCGFVGSRIIECLLQRGEKVLAFDRCSTIQCASDKRVKFICGDITELNALSKAFGGVDIVYMTVATVNFMDNLKHQCDASFKVNVLGMQNVIKQCIANNVQFLIHTSTCLVTVPRLDYDNYGMNCATVSVNVDESQPFVTTDNACSHYAATKAFAEQIVKEANGTKHDRGCLQTVSIRPLGIFGAFDKYTIEPMLTKNQYTLLEFSNVLNWSFVDNIVYAHLLAESKLNDLEKVHCVAGKAFCITDGNAKANADFRNMIKHYSDNKVKLYYGATRIVWLVAYMIEFLQSLLQNKLPPLSSPLHYLTLTALRIASMDIVINSTAAVDILGYKPIYTLDEGIQLSIFEFNDSKATVWSN